MISKDDKTADLELQIGRLMELDRLRKRVAELERERDEAREVAATLAGWMRQREALLIPYSKMPDVIDKALSWKGDRA